MSDQLFRWVKASERMPEIIERKSVPKWVKYMKKRWKGEPYEAKAVAYYFPDRFKTVEWEDWGDYDEKDFPYTENDKESGTVWLRAGWYSDIDCQKCDGHWSAPLEVIEWLEPLPSPGDNQSLEQAAKDHAERTYTGHGESKQAYFDSFLAGAAYVKGGEEKTDMGVYENYQRETTIAQSLSSIEESGLKEGEEEQRLLFESVAGLISHRKEEGLSFNEMTSILTSKYHITKKP